MNPNQHSDGKPQRRESDSPHGAYWWAIRIGAGCAAILGLSAVLALAFSIAISPVRHEIAAAADTADNWPSAVRLRTHIETEFHAADDSLRNNVSGRQQQIIDELHDVHRLLLRQRTH